MVIIAIIIAGIIFLIINLASASYINSYLYPGTFYSIAIFILVGIGIVFFVEEKRKKYKEAEIIDNKLRNERLRESERQHQIAAEQQQIEDEAATRKLREHVNELLDYATMLGTDGENSKLLQAMNDCINRLSEQRDIKDHHFNNNILRNDISIIFKKLESIGLQNDIVADRMQLILRNKELNY